MSKIDKDNNKRERFGWCLYDWANSAFATTVLAAILPVYFAGSVVPKEGVSFVFFGHEWFLSATSLWGYFSGLTALLILVSAPTLGRIADRSNRKKSFLMVFCYSGSLMTTLLFFSGPNCVFYTLFLFCLANYFFAGGNVFYDAFLPYLTKDMDRLSGQGYALGYLGGGLLLAINALFIQFSETLGLHRTTAVRLSLASAGIWWSLFGTIAFLLFREQRSSCSKDTNFSRAGISGYRNAYEAVRLIFQYRNILMFLLAYMIYNDGVQTVIKMASIFGKEELNLSFGTLLGTLLIVQFVGIWGALFISILARRFGSKKTIMATLTVWIGLTVFAYRMTSSLEYMALGVVVGLILGGTQAVSRSFYGSLIPKNQSAQFFGYFSVFGKLSAIWGPILFAFIRQVTGTSRLSILCLSLFFVVGFALLFFVNEKGSGVSSLNNTGNVVEFSGS